jgi:outer membrane protein
LEQSSLIKKSPQPPLPSPRRIRLSAEKRGISYTVFFIAFFFTFSFLIRSADAVELSMQDCVSMALENNRWLKSNEMDVQAAEQDVRIASSRFLPSLKLKGNYDLRDKDDFFLVPRDTFLSGVPPSDVELSADNQETYGVTFSVEQPVFTGMRLTNSYKKSQRLNDEARYGLERKKRILVFEVKKVFHEVLKEQLYAGILKKILDAKKEGLRVIQERNKEGYLSKEDLFMAENDLAASELEIFKTKNKAESALSNLRRLIYQQDDEKLVLKGEPANGSFTAALQEVKEFALANREDVKMSAARTQAAGADIMIAQGDFLPQVSLEGKYMMQKETNVTNPEQWMLSLQLDWSLFEWNRTKAEVSKAKALMQKQQYEHEDLMKRIIIQAEEAWRNVQEKTREVEVKEKQLKTAEYSFKQNAEKYSEGTIKMVNFLNAEAELIKAYNEYLVVINDLNIALAELEISASGMQESWFKRGDIYKPDFVVLSNIMKEAITKKEAKRPSYLNAKGVPPEKNVSSEKSPDGEKRAQGNTSTSEVKSAEKTTAYALQVGAFKSQESAVTFKKSLQKKVSHKKIKICRQGDFYKVRITGFDDIEQVNSMVNSGVDGLVIKTGDKACGI